MPSVRRILALAALGCAPWSGCADVRDEPLTNEMIYGGPPDVYTVQEEVEFASWSEAGSYGFPREGMPSIADLSALLPSESVPRTEPDLVIAAGTRVSTTECQGGAPAESAELPMVVEGVVTLHPRQYVKRPVCGQDERNYGSFVVEDDTGGILVLRNSRVAPFTFGDHVRLTVRAAGITAGDPETRAVVSADVEVLGPRVPVRFEPLDRSYAPEDVGATVRVEGWVMIPPSNANFNSMYLADQPVAAPGPVPMSGVCRDLCSGQCRRGCPSANNEACLDVICPSICSNNDNTFVPEEVPSACWEVSFDQELGRRGFSPGFGARVRATGPVMSSFGRKMWIQRIGQLEFLP